MANETDSAKNAAPAKTEAEMRNAAIQAYYNAATREAKAAVVKQFPFLETIFSTGNHS